MSFSKFVEPRLFYWCHFLYRLSTISCIFSSSRPIGQRLRSKGHVSLYIFWSLLSKLVRVLILIIGHKQLLRVFSFAELKLYNWNSCKSYFSLIQKKAQALERWIYYHLTNKKKVKFVLYVSNNYVKFINARIFIFLFIANKYGKNSLFLLRNHNLEHSNPFMQWNNYYWFLFWILQ